MPYAKVNDINIYYEIHGEGEPLVFVNGGGGNTKTQERQIPTYSPDYQMVIFDGRGAGQSDKPDVPYTMEIMADDIAVLMDAIGIQSAHIQASSMGGMIAQHFAIRYPERVKSLSLGSTGCGGNKTPMFSKEFKDISDRFLNDEISVSEMVKELLLLSVTKVFLSQNPGFLKLLSPMIDNPLPVYIWRHYIQAEYDHDTYNRLMNIKAPTLVMHGEKDGLARVENARLMASQIPNSELVVFENTGHLLIEAGNKPTELILDFRKRHSY